MGGSAGGYLSNMVGLLMRPGARVQAVVTLFGPSDFRGNPVNENVEALLDDLIKKKVGSRGGGGVAHYSRDQGRSAVSTHPRR